MLIAEILFWNDEPAETYGPDPRLDLSPARFTDDPANLANAFTRRGLVKHFWNINGSEDQARGPAPSGAETDVIPDGTSEPTTASWELEPVEQEPPVGLHRPVPFRQ